VRLVDVVLVIPKLPLLIVAGAYVGPSVGGIAAIIALTSWPPSARVLRAQVLSLRRRAHLRAALGFGAGTLRVLRRHVVPELGLILASGLVAAAGRAVALEAGLAFLGLGDPTRASWGSIMRDALDFSGLFYTRAWTWWLVPPVAAIGVLLVGMTFLGIAVEQRVNPRLARHTATGPTR
ncbi:MAG TPA: ABC transporter permease subunit, partial [Acidimicrobiales bacterium]|nr:ABC transporter permease subunit [Acidimicrobiales bacterium]